MTYKKQQSGFTLLEVLITVIILGVGLLGLASIQSLGLSQSNNSHFRNIATLQANAMADSIRANAAGRTAGHYDDIDSAQTNPGCILTGCTAQQMAQYDAYVWQQNLAFELPNGTGTVANSSGDFQITIEWQEKAADADGLDLTTQSYSILIKP